MEYTGFELTGYDLDGEGSEMLITPQKTLKYSPIDDYISSDIFENKNIPTKHKDKPTKQKKDKKYEYSGLTKIP